MKDKKRSLELLSLRMVTLLIGLLCCIAVVSASAKTDMDNAKKHLSDIVKYVSNQCVTYNITNVASETRSLMRIMESVQQIDRNLSHDRQMPHDALLAQYADALYLTGILYLTPDGRVEAKSGDLNVAEMEEFLQQEGILNVAAHPEKIYAVRINMPDGSYLIASESCALTSVGAELIRDLLPGEILVFSEEGVESRREHCGTQKQKTCIFEYIYFARPDSVIDKISVSAARIQAGKLLAQTKPVKADIVIGVPDSGLDAALGFSEVSGIPYGIGLVKNKYIGRTFISPGQKERIDLVRMKLSPIPSVIQGKRVVLIDDSIVRGTTSRQLVSLLREAGAKEIHLRISAPPFLHPCYYGTDIDSEENLIASHHGEKEVATLIGADSLGYLPLECLHELTGTHSYCDACFSGKYATEIPTDVRKDRFEQKLSER